MDNVRIHFFSATGNTARAVNLLRAQLEDAGISPEVHRITTQAMPPKGETGTEIIAFPVLGFAAPLMVLDYIKRMPRGNGRVAAVLCTCAGGSARTLPQVGGLLRRRGYRVNLTMAVKYPNNWTQFFNPGAPESWEHRLAQGDTQVSEFSRDFLGGTTNLGRMSLGTGVWVVPVSFLFGLLGRRLLGKSYLADDSCTSCGFCVRTCPAQSIILRGPEFRPVWKSSCQDCNRCINLCPSKSIQNSTLRFQIHVALSAVISLLAVGAAIPAALLSGQPWYLGLPLGIFVYAGVSAALTVVQFTFLDWLVTLAQTRLWPKAFSRSFTAGFLRYKAPGFRPE